MTSLPALLPPHDIEAEQAVIASVLVDGEAWAKVCGLLQPADFFRDKNGTIYAACADLVADGVGLNQVTVGHALARKEQLEEVGGIAYLSKLTTELDTPVGVEYYAQIVRRDALYRDVITRSGHLSAAAYRANGTLPGLLEDFLRNAEELRVAAAPMLGNAGRFEVIEGESYSVYEEEAPHVIDGIVPQVGVTIIAGMGESFKTWLCGDMAVCVAAGRNFLTRFGTGDGRPTVMFDQDAADPDELKRRLQKIAAGHGLDIENLAVISLVDQDINLWNASDYASVVGLLKERGAGLAVFDSAPDFFTGIHANDDEEVRRAMRTFKRLSRDSGAGVAATHHFRKSSKEGVNTPEERLFGSVYWRNKADSYLAVSLQGDAQILVYHGKARKRKREVAFVISYDGEMDDDFVKFTFAGAQDAEAADKHGLVERWLFQYLSDKGPVRRPDVLKAAAASKLAGSRTVEAVLGQLVGSGFIRKAAKPGEKHGVVYYWLDGMTPPEWTKTEAMI